MTLKATMLFDHFDRVLACRFGRFLQKRPSSFFNLPFAISRFVKANFPSKLHLLFQSYVNVRIIKFLHFYFYLWPQQYLKFIVSICCTFEVVYKYVEIEIQI